MKTPTADPVNSRNIPLPIQRKVRQRCGFGCVVCGLPLYEYEHMLGWANVRRHVADEITLLCDRHHREKTNGLLPFGHVNAANEDPFNLREGVSKPYDLHFAGGACTASIGGNTFTTNDNGYGTVMVPIIIDGVPILGFVMTDGHLLLNMNLFDENNELVLRIVNNSLFYSVAPWDITMVGKKLTIREGKGKFLVQMTFETPNKVTIERGRFLLNGVEVQVSPEVVRIVNNNSSFSRNTAINCSYGLALGTDIPQGGVMVAMSGIARYK